MQARLDCSELWEMVDKRIADLYVKLVDHQQLLPPKVFDELEHEIMKLWEDLEKWKPNECFDVSEFTTKLARLNNRINIYIRRGRGE